MFFKLPNSLFPRYILPGSSSTQTILQTSGQSVGKSFTALSSSGTIIGGQLTPATPSAAVDPSLLSPAEPMLVDSAGQTGSTISLLAPQRRASQEVDSTEYIPLGTRGRGRSRGRGRGRGGRTPRGRGRQQLVWSSGSDTEYSPSSSTAAATPSSALLSGRGGKASAGTLSELRQIGAHVIESSSEAVDGVPVVSIPDFTDTGTQAESASAAESLAAENAAAVLSTATTSTMDGGHHQAEGMSLLAQQSVLQEGSHDDDDASTQNQQEGPRVITQSIPSIKANHGFDILTQGILGSAATGRQGMATSPKPKTGRSLLTGAPAKISSLTTSADLSALTSAASKTQASLSMGHSVSQAEIETLIQAAEAAAKPAKLASAAGESAQLSQAVSSEEGMSVQEPSSVLAGEFGSSSQAEDQAELNVSQQSVDEPERMAEEEEERIVNVDESKVSAAERYRMPTELFQPDEESPEKPVRQEEPVAKLGSELPMKIFQESEVGSQEELRVGEDTMVSPDDDLDQLSSSKPSVVTTEEEVKEVGVGTDVDDLVDIESAEEGVLSPPVVEELAPTPKKKGGRRGRTKGGGGRRKSSSISASDKGEDSEEQSKLKKESAAKVHSPSKLSLGEQISKIASSMKGGKEVAEGSSPGKKSPVKSVGGFATDLLMETEREEAEELSKQNLLQEELGEKTQPEEEQGKENPPEQICEEKKEVEEKVEDSSVPEVCLESVAKEKEDCSVLQQLESMEVDVLAEEVEGSGEVKDSKDLSVLNKVPVPDRRKWVYLPAVLPCPKRKVVWSEGGDGEEEEEECAYLRPFNYRVLSGKLRKMCPRHASLGPRQESFTTPPIMFEAFDTRTDKKPEDGRAVVMRRSRRALERPRRDPAKDPQVIPLMADNDADAACVGGSVVSGALMEREMFCGVVVKQRQDVVDWSCGLEDLEEDVEADPEVADEDFRRHYQLQLFTGLFIQAGGFSSFLSEPEGGEEEDEAVQEGGGLHSVEGQEDCKVEELVSVVSGEGSNLVEVESGQVDIGDSSSGSQEVVKVKGRRGRKRKKRSGGGSMDSPDVLPLKCARSSQSSEGLSSPDISSLMSVDPLSKPPSANGDKDGAASTARLNGIDGAKSVTSPTPRLELTSQGLDPLSLSTGMGENPGQEPSAFASPARRSGRTHIPSKKVLDAQEDAPSRGSLKGRRASQASSDDELSDYSAGGEAALKKGKKTPLSPL